MSLLTGQVALITGGSRGIGEGVALRFAENGARVVINHSKSAAEAERVVEKIRGAGGTARAIQADVSVRDKVERMIADVLATEGQLDLLVNNAGVAIDGPIAEMSDDAWDRVLDVSLKGTFLCSQVAGRHMVERKSGRIINISAATALKGRLNGANFCAAKAGVISLTKCLALEYAPHVQVNCLLPGFTPTQEIIDRFHLNDPVKRERLLQTIPMRRFAEVEEIANGALFLASSMSNYVTGQLLSVNGGSYMG